jgi:hypothetical protein
LFVVCCLLFVVCCLLLFVVCCLLFVVVCCLLFLFILSNSTFPKERAGIAAHGLIWAWQGRAGLGRAGQGDSQSDLN